RGSKLVGEGAPAFGNAPVELRSHLGAELFERSLRICFEILEELGSRRSQLALPLGKRVAARRSEILRLLFRYPAEDLAKGRSRCFSGFVELRTRAARDFARDAIQMLANLGDVPERLLFEAGFKLAERFRHFFLQAASRRSDRLFDHHLQPGTRLLLKPFRGTLD